MNIILNIHVDIVDIVTKKDLMKDIHILYCRLNLKDFYRLKNRKVKEIKQKIIFRIEAVENDFGGVEWKTSIIGQKPAPITEDFKKRIYEDLNIDVDNCEYSTIQEVIE